jgi:MscS family membrane protein
MDFLSKIQAYIEKTLTYFQLDTWVIQVFIVVFLTLVLNFIVSKVLKKLAERTSQTSTSWDHPIFESMKSPAALLVWIIGIAFAAEIVWKETDAAIFSVVPTFRTVGVIFCLSWFLFRMIYNVEENIVKQKVSEDPSFDRTTADAIAKLLRVSVVITAFLVVLQSLGYSISGVLAFGGIGGIAIGFAARDLLANFFGGLMIYMDRPFAVGDWVRSPDRDIEGTVETIGWRLTVIRTFDKRPLYLPNSIFNTIAVENPSRMTNRRINETIGIRYDDAGKMADIVRDVKAMLKSHEAIDTEKTLIVNFNKFAASSLDFFIYTFTKTTNWMEYHEIKQDVMLKIIDIIEGHGAECAFPTSTLHIPDGINIEQS